ncbi:MAG: hypothetical protein QM817_23290 [Archangium sp.]
MDFEVIADWELQITGEIVRIEKDNIDKSGKNPRFVLTLFVEGEPTGIPEGAVVARPIPIRIKESELKVSVSVGARLQITARASGPRPTSLYASRITY